MIRLTQLSGFEPTQAGRGEKHSRGAVCCARDYTHSDFFFFTSSTLIHFARRNVVDPQLFTESSPVRFPSLNASLISNVVFLIAESSQEPAVLIDFTPVRDHELTYFKLGQRLTVADLKAATHASLDRILEILGDATDAEMVHQPDDPLADDPGAAPGEEKIGWSLAHLVAHVTASAEEQAAVSSILARGIPYVREPRLRWETPWRAFETRAQVLQRIEESRRIRIAYLDAWPDTPHLNVYREVSERFLEKWGPLNAPAAMLYGLNHEDGHTAQFRDVRAQAAAALAANAIRVPSLDTAGAAGD